MFLTKEQLGLNDLQYKGLHAALAALKAGTIVHIEDIYHVSEDMLGKELFFNMDVWSGTAYATDDKLVKAADEKGFVAGRTGYWNNNGSWVDLAQKCGSVCCIGGTAEFILNKKHLYEDAEWVADYDERIANWDSSSGDPEPTPQYADQMNALHYLFYPWDDERFKIRPNGKKMTKDEAIQALTSYLTTGDANWPSFHKVIDSDEYRD